MFYKAPCVLIVVDCETLAVSTGSLNCGIASDNMESVSYTHLDVYKRQVSNVQTVTMRSIFILAMSIWMYLQMVHGRKFLK